MRILTQDLAGTSLGSNPQTIAEFNPSITKVNKYDNENGIKTNLGGKGTEWRL